MWPLYVSKTIFNQTNSINQLYSQPISDFFIAEKPPSLALTTTFCLPFIIIARCVLGVLPLDISATFDTVNHDRFLFILYPGFLVCGTAIDRFRSNRTQFTLIAGKKLQSRELKCDVPQGSVLRAPLADVLRYDNMQFHVFVDYTQLYIYFLRNFLPEIRHYHC